MKRCRPSVLESAYAHCKDWAPRDWRMTVRFKFQGEEGIDAGGLMREWYHILAREIFDQNKDRRIGWDEILAVTGHNDPKMKREFQEAAGEDMKMDYKEFHKFMNKETGKKFFF